MAIYNGDGTLFLNVGNDPTFTDEQCVTAFMAEVNKKAELIGMSSSNFVRPAGDSPNLQTTARDMARLTLIASSYKKLAEVWSKDVYYVTPRNSDTPVELDSTVLNDELNAVYPILGAKTGSWASPASVTYACICNVNGEQVVGYIHNTDKTTRFTAAKELMDIALDVIQNGSTSQTVTNATEAIAVRVPTYYTANYEQQALDVLYEQNADDMIIPASTTKIITVITALDWIDDLSDTFEFVSSDMVGGSGAVFSVGDVISYRDALYAIMLPSSNQSAQAVARMVGKKILTKNTVY